jgi:TonB family protein
VLIEFRTSPTGEISGLRVRETSGHAVLDQAALENLRTGRWKGQPGFYVKAFEFTLQ